MAKHGTQRIERFVSVHWTAGILLGVSAYVCGHYVIGAHNAAQLTVGWIALCCCWFGAFLCCLGYRKRVRRIAVRDELNRLGDLHWRDFENQVAQAFRYRGYAVEHAGHTDIDSGLDLIVHKHGLTTLVQCRHWRNRNVELKDVREMYSLMKHHHASAVKLVACDDYTAEAWKFVLGKPIELIYGETLLAMLGDAKLAADNGVVPFRAPASPPPMHHRARTAAH